MIIDDPREASLNEDRLVLALLLVGAAIAVSGQSSDSKLQAQLKQIFPSATGFSPKEGQPPHFKAYAGGQTIGGYAFWTTELEPLERAYDGPIKILVGMDTKGVLAGVIVVDHTSRTAIFRSIRPSSPPSSRARAFAIRSRSAPTSTPCRGRRSASPARRARSGTARGGSRGQFLTPPEAGGK